MSFHGDHSTVAVLIVMAIFELLWWSPVVWYAINHYDGNVRTLLIIGASIGGLGLGVNLLIGRQPWPESAFRAVFDYLTYAWLGAVFMCIDDAVDYERLRERVSV